MRVVLTRPYEDAERTARALRGRGHEVMVAPLMRIEPIEADLSGNWSAVVITSANALGAITEHARAALLSLPLFAVGERSATAAKASGFADIHWAAGDVHDLVRLVAAQYARQLSRMEAPVLYLAGEDRAADLVKELEARGIQAQMRVVYRAIALPFPLELAAALRGRKADAIVHFSKRSAENYLTGARATGLTGPALAVRHLCLSAPIAEPLAAAGATRVAVAARPDESALIELLSTLSD